MLRFRAAAFVGSRRAGRRRRFSGRRRAGGGSQGYRAAMPEVVPADEPFRNPVGMRYRIFLFRVQCFLVSGAGDGRRREVRPRCGEAAEVPERETGGAFQRRFRPFAPSCPASDTATGSVRFVSESNSRRAGTSSRGSIRASAPRSWRGRRSSRRRSGRRVPPVRIRD